MKTGSILAENLQELTCEGWDASIHIAMATLGVEPTKENYYNTQSLLKAEDQINKLEPLIRRRSTQLNRLKTRRDLLRARLGVPDADA